MLNTLHQNLQNALAAHDSYKQDPDLKVTSLKFLFLTCPFAFKTSRSEPTSSILVKTSLSFLTAKISQLGCILNILKDT